MLKSMSLIKRKAGMSQEAFRLYYEEVHAPAALKRFPIKKYCRNYVIVPSGAPEPQFDCITEYWWETMEDWQGAVKIWREQGGLGDEASFMELSKVVSFGVEEVLG
jgi:hypothetical protein